MKPAYLIILWTLTVLLLAVAVGLVYLVLNQVEATVGAYQDFYLANRARADLDNWRAMLENSAADRARLETVFVSRQSLIKFIEELETIAREQKIKLTLEEPLIGPQKLTLALAVKGSFPDIYRWLKRLENLPYQLFFESVDLAGGAGWNGRLRLELHSFDEPDI